MFNAITDTSYHQYHVAFAMVNIWITSLALFFLVFHILPALGTKSVQRDNNFRFAHFTDHFFHVLVEPELEFILVTDRNVCLLRCLKEQRCFSTNIAASPDLNGSHICMLLPTDKYNASNSFWPSQHFHHYSLKVRY